MFVLVVILGELIEDWCGDFIDYIGLEGIDDDEYYMLGWCFEVCV